MPTRRKRKSQADDPVVQEVRAIRARMCKEAGGTIEGLMRLVREEVPEAYRARRTRRRQRV